jgi:hypothetical protein
MIRVPVALWGMLSLLAAGRQAGASSLPAEAFGPPPLNCEQPATAAPAPRSDTTQRETISQIMEAWWREHSQSGNATQDKPPPSTLKEALGQMDTWWRERTDLHNGIASEQAPAGMKEAMTQMEAWWEQTAKVAHTPADKSTAAIHHRRHRQASVPPIEYGCPPSVCTIQSGNH